MKKIKIIIDQPFSNGSYLVKKIVVSQHQTFLDEPILFENVEIDESKIYFVYIGEIKAYGLNIFLKRYWMRIY